MSYVDRKIRILGYLREHPRGSTTGELSNFGRLGPDITAAVIRSILDELTVEGRVDSRVEVAKVGNGAGYLREFRLYHAIKEAI